MGMKVGVVSSARQRLWFQEDGINLRDFWLFFVLLGFECRTLHLLGRCSTA
jgi:hypothetical protein